MPHMPLPVRVRGHSDAPHAETFQTGIECCLHHPNLHPVSSPTRRSDRGPGRRFPRVQVQTVLGTLPEAEIDDLASENAPLDRGRRRGQRGEPHQGAGQSAVAQLGGHGVCECVCGAVGFEAAAAAPVDVVLIDGVAADSAASAGGIAGNGCCCCCWRSQDVQVWILSAETGFGGCLLPAFEGSSSPTGDRPAPAG
uniref:(northern house mosquito) hypothetical protein n=2 Tax=Culex pipiens TaxID=7175 RepID=A0A8D8PBI4_CULPI